MLKKFGGMNPFQQGGLKSVQFQLLYPNIPYDLVILESFQVAQCVFRHLWLFHRHLILSSTPFIAISKIVTISTFYKLFLFDRCHNQKT